MSSKNENIENSFDSKDHLLDNSIDEAKWLLGGVAMLGFLVMAVGLFASTLAV